MTALRALLFPMAVASCFKREYSRVALGPRGEGSVSKASTIKSAKQSERLFAGSMWAGPEHYALGRAAWTAFEEIIGFDYKRNNPSNGDYQSALAVHNGILHELFPDIHQYPHEYNVSAGELHPRVQRLRELLKPDDRELVLGAIESPLRPGGSGRSTWNYKNAKLEDFFFMQGLTDVLPETSKPRSEVYGAFVSLSGDFYSTPITQWYDTWPAAITPESNKWPQKFDRLMNPQLGNFTQEEAPLIIDELKSKEGKDQISDQGWLESVISLNYVTGLSMGLMPYLSAQATSGEVNKSIDGNIKRNFWQWWHDKKGQYKFLAENNMDHFGSECVQNWAIIDKAALTRAHDAGVNYKVARGIRVENIRDENKKNLELSKALKQLERAFEEKAVGAHFASDRRAAGHIRTARKQLEAICPHALSQSDIPMDLHQIGVKTRMAWGSGASIGGVMSKVMHDQDGDSPIWIMDGDVDGIFSNLDDDENLRARTMPAFGDGEFFTRENGRNKDMTILTLVEDLIRVVQAFGQGYYDEKLDMDALIAPSFPQVVPPSLLKRVGEVHRPYLESHISMQNMSVNTQFPMFFMSTDMDPMYLENKEVYKQTIEYPESAWSREEYPLLMSFTRRGEHEVVIVMRTQEDCETYLGGDFSIYGDIVVGCWTCPQIAIHHMPEFFKKSRLAELGENSKNF